MFENEYIKELLVILGVPEISFEYADPSSLFLMLIFSTEALTFLLAIVIWVIFFLFSSSDKWGIGEQQSKSEENRNIHSYNSSDMRQMISKHKMGNMSEMGGMNKMNNDTGLFSIVIGKFILPVFIIFIVLYVAIKMFGFISYG